MTGKLTLRALLEGLVPDYAGPDCPVSGLVLDSRKVRAGDVFVAIGGTAGHGLDYVDSALRAGCAAILHDGGGSTPDCPEVPVVEVHQLGRQLDVLARRMWGDPGRDLDLVAVTGTNGKSSVAWLLAQALDGAMIGTLGVGRPGEHLPADMTTPDLFTLYRELARLRDSGLRTVVLEASSHALDQGRLAGLCFTSVIFTTLGHDHLDYHADRNAYAEAKARLFTDFVSQRQLINLDDLFGRELAGRLAGPGCIGYSRTDQADASVRVDAFTSSSEGLSARLWLDQQVLEVRSCLIGQVNLWNLMVVAAELAERGRSLPDIAEQISRLMPVPGRMQPVRDGDGRLAVIDYAHTPDALDNALVSLRELTRGELWCVFGCGGNRDSAKRDRMGRIAEGRADHVVLTDDNPRHEDGLAIIRDIQAGMQRPERSIVIRDRARAIHKALSDCAADDVVLIAGKGHETEQVIGDQRLPFDDAVCARQALEALPC
ncbi:UDP-N-acetylmuramoyl-L-alanyl-D-glutamate--2,6-diaminopimelate ligase [Wenzhouxiangella sp. AB-CW3]|uniref:UDP-N-acetylmuramoyl-L-alanyl-D-glutamate--2, 6-diaminopimelate ligase n=1 Tax=Wenzhouxiangella sp. AB-CW3 TaxID=2771012 RepID=UPI00168B69FC|nr:UDP-N-acetylmuramoyl-L-alanyl-D-glutamate--2,6-diaminopimelate ligase [Wenzhouxiangella sp. AB-CW3]QOC23195.1 UDP-N-acetylmuramoyl-L-alanyl-D-glutamate--2,6-diaminopimelate ligase [Wenzhouxiangella sp. AB-CW3]